MQRLMLSLGFYLITTDILGPYGIGFSMGTLGWGPGGPPFRTISASHLTNLTKESHCTQYSVSWPGTLDI